MKYKCGCVIRKITKEEKKDYPEDITFIQEKFCKIHEKQIKKVKDEKYKKRGM